jgi:hypothetical protein
MSGWGSGDPWGSGSDFTQRMVARLLMFVQHGPRFVALVNALATRTGDLRDAASTIVAAFDIDTAVGVQLDTLGAILQRPRYGMTDDRYRDLLHVQIDLILSSTASAETLLAVVERITGAPAPTYTEHYPAQFRIGAIVDPDDVTLLRSLLRQAKGWGIYGGLIAYPEGVAPGEGGVLLGDIVADEGVWSLVSEDRAWAVRMTSTGADDIESGDALTLDGSTHVPAFEARNFDGATNRIDDTDPPLDLSLPQAFTVAAWVRLETLAGLRVIWVAAAASGPAQSMILRSNGDAIEFSHAFSAGTSLRRVSAVGVLTVGTWHHVAAAFPGNDTAAQTTLFVDGSEVASYSLTTDGAGTPRAADGPWSIGGRIESDANCTDGDVASVDVWPRELGPEEIAHLYEEGITASGSFAGPPDDSPRIDNPGVGDLVTPTYALAYPTAQLVII